MSSDMSICDNISLSFSVEDSVLTVVNNGNIQQKSETRYQLSDEKILVHDSLLDSCMQVTVPKSDACDQSDEQGDTSNLWLKKALIGSIVCEIYVDPDQRGLKVVVTEQDKSFRFTEPRELKISHSHGNSTDVVDRTVFLNFKNIDSYGFFHEIPQWDMQGSLTLYKFHVSFMQKPTYEMLPLRSLPTRGRFAHEFEKPWKSDDTLILFNDGYAYVCIKYLATRCKDFEKAMKLLTEADKNENGYYLLKCETTVSTLFFRLGHIYAGERTERIQSLFNGIVQLFTLFHLFTLFTYLPQPFPKLLLQPLSTMLFKEGLSILFLFTSSISDLFSKNVVVYSSSCLPYSLLLWFTRW